MTSAAALLISGFAWAAPAPLAPVRAQPKPVTRTAAPAAPRAVSRTAGSVRGQATVASPPAVSATSGGIAGTVTVRAPASPGSAESAPDPDRSGVVVYLTGFTQPPPETRARIVQKDKLFFPPVVAITEGQSVDFPNEDPLFHNVFSVSKAREFDLGMTRAPEVKTVEFGKRGLVDVYCNIHPEMASTVLVLPNRAFAVTGRDGSFAIRDVPPGTHTIYAWNRRADVVKRPVTVAAGQVVRMDFELLLTKSIPPHKDKYGREYRRHSSY